VEKGFRECLLECDFLKKESVFERSGNAISEGDEIFDMRVIEGGPGGEVANINPA
jgi:hypothetical protein